MICRIIQKDIVYFDKQKKPRAKTEEEAKLSNIMKVYAPDGTVIGEVIDVSGMSVQTNRVKIEFILDVNKIKGIINIGKL